jgi:hypothetical protein
VEQLGRGMLATPEVPRGLAAALVEELLPLAPLRGNMIMQTKKKVRAGGIRMG